MGPCAHTLSGGQEGVLLKEPMAQVLSWVNRERESGGSNLKSLAMGWWEKWGFILALKLSLDSCCLIGSAHGPQGLLCLPVCLPPGGLSLTCSSLSHGNQGAGLSG